LRGNTIHFADVLIDYQLFRTLFIFKVPYLIFDFAIGWALIKLLKSDNKKSLLAYKVWMLNPFTLYTCYAAGQVDIIITFFVMMAMYCTFTHRRYFAVMFLALSVLTKTLTVVLIPFAILLLAKDIKEILRLSLTAIITMIVLLLPFYLSSPPTILESLLFSSDKIPLFRQLLFFIGYLGLFLSLFFIKREKERVFDLTLIFFSASLLLFYAFCAVTIRYFVILTPLLIYLATQRKIFWFYNLAFFIALFELRCAGEFGQWALFAAIHPEFFSGLAVTDTFLNLLINVKLVHQWMYRFFVISSLAMALHIYVMQRNIFKSLSFKSAEK
jgi:hypothetical protein